MIALITGITGQDGSYLAEFLLDKGYEVHGVVRRSSLEKFDRIAHLKGRIALHQGDLLDQLSLLRVVEKVRPDELYNLAAQSFVPTSWEQPLLTGEFTALGVTRVLEAIRQVDPGIRFYQASSSEMFGKVRQTPQNEATPFYPRSPYGVAKVYGHFITVNYRESYDLFAVSGILFNHECVTAETPVIVRRDGLLRILPIEDLVPHRSDPASGTKHTGAPTRPLEVWDRGGWTRVTQMTATWNDASRPEHKPVRTIAARGALFSATHGHVAFREGGEQVRIEQITEGDRLELIDLPPATNAISMTEDEAWLLGALVAEGHIGDRRGRFTSSDPDLVDRVAEAWCRVTGGRTSRGMGVSGFEGGAPAVQSNLAGAPDFLPWVRAQIYTRSGYKRVPVRVLNGDEAARRAFLSGYNEGDGLRAGHGDSEFKSFETSSAALAQGLWWLVSETLGHRTILCTEERDGRRYYRVSLNSPANPVGEDTGKGIHLRRPRAEVVEADDGGEAGWVFDLATESGTFQAGIGRGWIHNSPRRGLEFVTRKVSWNAAGIARGLADRLPMGNLEARRDWGFAGDYVVAMWKMLQQDQPEDFVIGTGTTHSVRDLLEVAFDEVGLDWRDYVEEDPAFLRPAEVEQLCADATRAKEKLGWAPSVTFQELVRMMVRADLDRIDRGAAASEGP